MSRRKLRRSRSRPPRWFVPAVLTGIAVAGALLSVAMLAVVE
ncbi:hypothetical protein [Sphingobium herbicidovorans]|nr:hypothetical protein [Sphingobium herbicidovorans]